MVVLAKPYLGCNMACAYCYENAHRSTHSPKMDYNIEAVLKAMERELTNEHRFGLHGGEPLCMPKEDVARILAKSKELKDYSSIQTNGTLIDQDFIEIFKQNKTHVGISCDGIEELNEYRGCPDYPYGGIIG